MAAALVALILLLGTFHGLEPSTPNARADDSVEQTKQEIEDKKKQLHKTKMRIRERAKKLRALQRQQNRLATAIAQNQDRVQDARERLGDLGNEVSILEVRADLLQGKLDERNRETFIMGPGAPVLYLLTATSAAEAAARMSILTEMNRRDEILAAKVEETQERLSRRRAEMVRLQLSLELALRELEIDQAKLQVKFRESKRLFAKLQVEKEEILTELSKLRPFAVCPVGDPHAVGDGFGLIHHHSKKEGGTHAHQGNDIMAPMGTPIYAPFDGVAVTSRNEIGGKAVKVYGEFGFVYNAHLSVYGKLGPVETGDVVGYVGATGNASGPHDHFEWHPDDGEAVDPYPFLMLVC